MTDFNLTPGSRYRITSVRTREDTFEIEGTFQGITSLGSVDAMVMEETGGSEDATRLIPTHVVLQVEVLEEAGEEDLDDEDQTMYT